MASALLELQRVNQADLWDRSIVPQLTGAAKDEFKFRRETGLTPGLISWKHGEQLIGAARATLLAGAKSFREPYRHFSGRFTTFAGRYLDSVLMGQTGSGSYIVTAYAPATATVALETSSEDALGYDGIDTVPTRDVTLAVVQAVEATVEAIEHFKSWQSFSGFENGVNQGVSYEMTQALFFMSRDADGAEVSVEWHGPRAPAGFSAISTYALSGGDAAILSAASDRLIVPDSSPLVTLVGRVHLLTKDQLGGPGVFGIETADLPGSSGLRRVRVRLLAGGEAYHDAVRAHDEDRSVRVTGRLQPGRRITWLNQARLDAIVDNAAPVVDPGRSPQVPGQDSLFRSSNDDDH